MSEPLESEYAGRASRTHPCVSRAHHMTVQPWLLSSQVLVGAWLSAEWCGFAFPRSALAFPTIAGPRMEAPRETSRPPSPCGSREPGPPSRCFKSWLASQDLRYGPFILSDMPYPEAEQIARSEHLWLHTLNPCHRCSTT
ncbi:hypothetical protein LIA77_11021 [Sarocladium implicatum]|nr:hypothetical protein LIA77_11021 [Sarocladium implicatum]